MESENTSLKWVVAVDGSPASKDAFLTVADGLMKKGDRISVVHIFNRNKKYLDFRMQPESIRMDYDSECIGRFGKKFSINMVENFDGKKSTKEIVSEVAEEQKGDVLVVGFHGRKGPKEDPTIFGSAVFHLALNPVSPVLIVKDKHTRPADKDFVWLICTDGSESSFKAFNQAVKLLDKTRDSVVGLYVK